MLKKYTYHWLHIPTKEKGVNFQYFMSELQFLAELNRWNGSMPGKWQYWAIDTLGETI